MEFKKYPKVYHLGKAENDGILFGECHVQEKIDGANLSIWLDNGEICVGSRNQEVTEKGFNGAVDYVQNHEGIKSFFADNPNKRLYGEWLVKHTISYKETAYRKFYLFDIWYEEEDKFMSTGGVHVTAEHYAIDTPHYYGAMQDPHPDDLKKLVGESFLGDNGEGIVIKNPDFTNKFGDNAYAKIVAQDFKENNGITFGGNNKTSDTYWEMYVVNKYMTLARVRKVVQKTESATDEKMEMKHVPRIMQTAYHDMLTEEIWDIAKKAPALNLKKLQSIAYRKAKMIFIDILNDDISIAFKE